MATKDSDTLILNILASVDELPRYLEVKETKALLFELLHTVKLERDDAQERTQNLTERVAYLEGLLAGLEKRTLNGGTQGCNGSRELESSRKREQGKGMFLLALP